MAKADRSEVLICGRGTPVLQSSPTLHNGIPFYRPTLTNPHNQTALVSSTKLHKIVRVDSVLVSLRACCTAPLRTNRKCACVNASAYHGVVTVYKLKVTTWLDNWLIVFALQPEASMPDVKKPGSTGLHGIWDALLAVAAISAVAFEFSTPYGTAFALLFMVALILRWQRSNMHCQSTVREIRTQLKSVVR